MMKPVFFSVASTAIAQSAVKDAQFLSDILTCPTKPAETTKCLTTTKYQAVKDSVKEVYDNMDPTCSNTKNSCPQADFAGCVLRLAGHDMMDFNKEENNGGSDGCIDFEDEENKGLRDCLDAAEHHTLSDRTRPVTLQTAYEQHCDTISLADFVVMAAEAVMERTAPAEILTFQDAFRFGRTTKNSCSVKGRLPKASAGCQLSSDGTATVESVFMDNIGLTWPETTAVLGAHTLGRAEARNSGNDGWWTSPENARVFDNGFYKQLLLHGWAPETSPTGVHQWAKVSKESKHFDQMMLNSDICLAYNEDASGNGDDNLTAPQDNCCAWMPNSDLEFTKNKCGNKKKCCGSAKDLPSCDTQGPANKEVQRFAADEHAWLVVFWDAWFKLSQAGYEQDFLKCLVVSDDETCTAEEEVNASSCPRNPIATTGTTTPCPDKKKLKQAKKQLNQYQSSWEKIVKVFKNTAGFTGNDDYENDYSTPDSQDDDENDSYLAFPKAMRNFLASWIQTENTPTVSRRRPNTYGQKNKNNKKNNAYGYQRKQQSPSKRYKSLRR